MFCNHCGGRLEADQRFCASCGKPVAPVAAPTPPASGRLARHLSILAVFWIVISVFRLIGSGAVLAAPDTILLVEDDPGQAELICVHLEIGPGGFPRHRRATGLIQAVSIPASL